MCLNNLARMRKAAMVVKTKTHTQIYHACAYLPSGEFFCVIMGRKQVAATGRAARAFPFEKAPMVGNAGGAYGRSTKATPCASTMTSP